MASEVDELVRDIKATGKFDVRSAGPHHKVVNGEGKTIYTFGKTPSDHRWRDNAVRGLIREGVFEHDPKKTNGQKERSQHRLADPEIQAKKVAAIKARSEHFAEITRDIRARLEPLITRAGGWGTHKGQITASELGLAARYWGRDRPDVFKTDEAARNSAQTNMRQGGTCSEKACGFWDAFVTAWESADDTRRWYFDLVREYKGLSPTAVIVGGAEVKPPATEPKNLRRAGRVKRYMAEPERHPLEPEPLIGQLALKAVFLMAVGRENADQDEILGIGEQILVLEAESREEDE